MRKRLTWTGIKERVLALMLLVIGLFLWGLFAGSLGLIGKIKQFGLWLEKLQDRSFDHIDRFQERMEYGFYKNRN